MSFVLTASVLTVQKRRVQMKDKRQLV